MCTSAPLVPVTVKRSVLNLVLGAVIVSVEVVLAGFAEKRAVNVPGRPETLNATAPVKPLRRLTVTV